MTEWVISCNTKEYDVVGAFSKYDTIDWKQSTNVAVGVATYEVRNHLSTEEEISKMLEL